MQHVRRSFIPVLLAWGIGIALSAPASAQLWGPYTASVSSSVSIAAGNLASNGSIPEYYFVGDGSSTGDPVSVSILPGNPQTTFSGYDSQGKLQTMNFSGTASAAAEFGGIFHAAASGQVTNVYYNPSNPAYYVGGYTPNPAGSPQYFDIAGSAFFQDALIFDPSTTPVVGLRYLFHLEGTDTAHYAYADLGFNAGMNSYSIYVDGSDPSVTDWATPEWSVSTLLPIPISGEFQSVFGVNTNPLYAPEGQNAVGISNFYDTLTLSGIQLLDANGNQVNGVGYISESGTHYNVLGGYYASAVPEPGAVTLLLGTIGAGLLAMRRRGRNRH